MRKNQNEDIPRDDEKRHRQIESGQETEKKRRERAETARKFVRGQAEPEENDGAEDRKKPEPQALSVREDDEEPMALKEEADLQRRGERKRQEAVEKLYDQEDMEYIDMDMSNGAEEDENGGIEDDAGDDEDGGMEDDAEEDEDGGMEDDAGEDENGSIENGTEDDENNDTEDDAEDSVDTDPEDNDLEDLEDLGFDGESDNEEEWGDEDGWEDEEEDEEEPAKPWLTAVVFLVLIVLAAGICAALWHFSHRDSPEEGDTAMQGQASGAAESGGASAASGASAQEGDTAGSGGDLDQQFREPVSGTKDMEFTEVQQSVTPKDVINLRSVPDTLDTDNIVAQVQNGEVLLRTGINEDTGWSEIEYEGQTLYGVTQYLTTDLDYKPIIETSNPNRVSTKDGRVIIFADCNDWISPKEYVNLRTEPSTTEGNETVSCQLNYGEKVHRTGYSPDSGWSRVEYNDQVLYVVTSLMQAAEEE